MSTWSMPWTGEARLNFDDIAAQVALAIYGRPIENLSEEEQRKVRRAAGLAAAETVRALHEYVTIQRRAFDAKEAK